LAEDSRDAIIIQLQAEVDKLKAQAEATTELRKVNSEKFSRHDEVIGEIRTSLANLEKSLGRVEAKATKAEDLVTQLEPEKIILETQKSEAKMEGLRAKIESNQVLGEKFLEQISELRRDVAKFKGVEEVFKMSQETKKNLGSIERFSAMVDKNTNKVENIFMQVKENFQDFKKYELIAKLLDESFKEMRKEFDNLKINLEKFIGKQELKELQDKNESRFVEFNNKLEQLKEHSQEIEKLGREGKIREENIDKFEEKYLNLLNKQGEVLEQLGIAIDTSENTKNKVDDKNEIVDTLEVGYDDLRKTNDKLKDLVARHTTKLADVIDYLRHVDKVLRKL